LKTKRTGSGNFNEGLRLLYSAETNAQGKKARILCLPLKLSLLLAAGENFTKFCR